MASGSYIQPIEETIVYERGKYKIIERDGLYRVSFISGEYRHEWPRRYKRLANAKNYLHSIVVDAYGWWSKPMH